MRVRKAGPADLPSIGVLARSLDLDYPGMDGDTLWVAEADRGRIVGAVALRRHPDCLELCALGVDPDFRGKGVGRALVEALVAEAPGDVHLATIIPRFFESCGFERASDAPRSFLEKPQTGWCEGCPRERCVVMRRTKP